MVVSSALIGHHATAFVVATLAALVGNGVLQLALDAVAVGSYGGGAPWWVTAEVIERGRWVVFAVLLRMAGPRLLASSASSLASPEGDDERSAAWQRVGLLVLILPLLWIAATWVVSAVRFTALDSWGTEGLAFRSTDYYQALLLDYAPWLIGGSVVKGVGRHL